MSDTFDSDYVDESNRKSDGSTSDEHSDPAITTRFPSLQTQDTGKTTRLAKAASRRRRREGQHEAERRGGRVDSQAQDSLGFVAPTLYDGNIYPPSYYKQKGKTTNIIRFQKRKYAPKTVCTLDRILEVWCQYCRHIRKKDWLDTMRNLNLEHAESFLYFHLNLQLGKSGGCKRGTKITRSVRTFSGSFRLLFRRETLTDIDWAIDRNAVNMVGSDGTPVVDSKLIGLQLIGEVFEEFHLSSERRENRPMTLDQLKEQIETTLQIPEKKFKLGEIRLQNVLFMLLLAPTGSRLHAVLKIRYRDIEIALHQCEGGPPPRSSFTFG